MDIPQQVPAILFHGPDDIRVEDVPLGPMGDDDIVVRVHYTMVSSGTELRALTGFYQASCPFPFIPGYSSVGEVIARGASCLGYEIGDLVSCRNPNRLPGVNACWGGQAGVHVCNTRNPGTRPILLPAGANPLDYVTAEISAISLRGMLAAAPEPGQTVVVIGLGPIGAFSAAWFRRHGCRVVATDLSPPRLERAARWGVHTVPGGRPETEARLAALIDGGANIVVESSGSMGGVALASRLLRKVPAAHGEPVAVVRGRWPILLLQATYREPVSLAGLPGEGALVLTPKDRGIGDRQAAVEALRDGSLRGADFLDRVVSHREAPAAYRQLRDDKDAVFSVVFDWSDAH